MLSSFLWLAATASAAVISERQTLSGSTVCRQIASGISGGVYYTLSSNYIQGSSHWMTSSSQVSMCVVEPASPADVSTIMKIVGANRTPFAIKSGGHASNQGFSSTSGVLINMVRLNQVVLSADGSTAEVGTGNHWTDVYAALDGTGRNVVGGRVSGPGVGGFTLGGGYSWLTDQYGLTCDTVAAFNIVLPNGTFTKVTSANADLFFALKGGLNRFGVVTSIVFKTVAQPALVYGGANVFAASEIPALLDATLIFQNTNTDPKAQVITTINGGPLPNVLLLLFYDGADPGTTFDMFNTSTALITGAKTQSYAAFSTGSPSEVQAGHRGAFHSMMTTGFTPTFLNAIYNESTFYGALAVLHGATLLSYDVEPFLKYGDYATDSAFPHSMSPLPLNLYYSWEGANQDSFWRGVMQQSINHLTEVAKAEGIFDASAPVYPNYALDTYTGAALYGATNAARLRKIQTTYDPNGVMLLTGGFSF